MKKITTFLVVFVFITATNCSSDDSETPIDTNITYAGSVKALMEDNCFACHIDPPINGAPIALTTFDLVKDAVENKGLITRIANGNMPPGNLPKLSAEEVQLVRDWQAGGFKE